MKKIFLIILSCFLFTTCVYATPESVTLISCDGATSMWVNTSEGVKRIRPLIMDTSDGTLNKEINEYVCSLVKNASILEIEKDPLSEDVNKYNEHLVYIYVDGTLLQENLIKLGYAQVNYVYNDYREVKNLCNLQATAIKEHLGIWSYPNIKEEYCNSGVEIKNEKEIKSEEEEKTIDNEYLKKMVLINSIIVVFLIIVMKRKNNEEK